MTSAFSCCITFSDTPKYIRYQILDDISHGYSHEPLIEGSLEVKLPTIRTDGKAKVGRVRAEKKRSEKIREEKEREERRCTLAKR